MNNTSTAGASDAVRNRRLVVLGVLLILAAAAITGGRLIYSRMQQVRLTQDRPKDLQYGVSVYSPETAATAGSKRDKYLAKASLLRDHWRAWAVAHQGLLRQLRQAPPNDYATLMRVYRSLPYRMDKSTGVTDQDLAFNLDDFNAGRGILFGWQPGPLKARIPEELAHNDPAKAAQAQAASDRSDASLVKKLHRDFAAYHGIMLSESVSAGSSRITLWADGRITEMTRQDQRIVGKPTVIDGPEKEIVPAYDFLK